MKSLLVLVVLVAISYTPYINAAPTDGIQDLLAIYDEDGNGVISEAEFIKSVQSADPNKGEDEIRAAFNDVDKNGDGGIDGPELHDMMVQVIVSEQGKKLIFEHLDLNGDGSLTGEELSEHLSKDHGISSDHINEMIHEADTDGDGQINYGEYDGLITKVRSHM